MDVPPQSLATLNARIVNCERCPRLRAYCAEIARNYPDLRDEYFGNLDAIRNLNVESQMEMDRRL